MSGGTSRDRHPQPTSPRSSSARGRSRPRRRSSPRISSAIPRSSCSARRRCCWRRAKARRAAARRSMAAPSLASAADGNRIVTGGDDGKVVATDAEGESSGARDRRQAPLDRPRGGRPERQRWPGRQASRRSCARGKGAERALEVPLDRRRIGVRAEGPAPRHRPLQRRHALVSERAEPSPRSWNGRARISAPA